MVDSQKYKRPQNLARYGPKNGPDCQRNTGKRSLKTGTKKNQIARRPPKGELRCSKTIRKSVVLSMSCIPKRGGDLRRSKTTRKSVVPSMSCFSQKGVLGEICSNVFSPRTGENLTFQLSAKARNVKEIHFKNTAENKDLCLNSITAWFTNPSLSIGYRAVFTEQSASASEMSAAKFLDTIPRFCSTAKEVNDAISTHTRKC